MIRFSSSPRHYLLIPGVIFSTILVISYLSRARQKPSQEIVSGLEVTVSQAPDRLGEMMVRPPAEPESQLLVRPAFAVAALPNVSLGSIWDRLLPRDSGGFPSGREQIFTLMGEPGRLIYVKVENGVKEKIILDQPPQSEIFQFRIELSNLDIKIRHDNLWYFYDKGDLEGKPLFYIPQPFMTDSKGERTEAVEIHHVYERDLEYLEVEPNQAWLTDPERTYPVEIDPSFKIYEDEDELTELRTETSKTFANSDGTKTLKAHAGLIHYRDKDGDWREADLTFKKSAGPEYAFETTLSGFKVFFKGELSGDHYLKYQKGETAIFQGLNQIQEGLGQLNPSPKIVVKDDTLTYQEVFAGIDLRYQLTKTKLLEEYIIKEPKLAQEISTLSQTMQIERARYEPQEDGSLVFYQLESGEQVFRFPEPAMYELPQKAQPSITAKNYGLDYELNCQEEKEGYCHRLEIAKVLNPEGKDWLLDGERRYPVAVDTTTTYYGQTIDGIIYYARYYSTSCINYGQAASTGDQDVVTKSWFSDGWFIFYRAYLSFDTSALPDCTSISQAKLKLKATYDAHNDLDPVYGGQDCWGPSLTTADYNACTTSAGQFPDASTGTWGELTISSVGSIVNKTGRTQFRMRASSELSCPGDDFDAYSSADVAGTSSDPQLEVTYGCTPGSCSGNQICEGDCWTTSLSSDWHLNGACTLNNDSISINGSIYVENGDTLDMSGTTDIDLAGTNRYVYVYNGGMISIDDTAGFNK